MFNNTNLVIGGTVLVRKFYHGSWTSRVNVIEAKVLKITPTGRINVRIREADGHFDPYDIVFSETGEMHSKATEHNTSYRLITQDEADRIRSTNEIASQRQTANNDITKVLNDLTKNRYVLYPNSRADDVIAELEKAIEIAKRHNATF